MKTEQSMKSSRLSTDINNTNSRPKLEEEKPRCLRALLWGTISIKGIQVVESSRRSCLQANVFIHTKRSRMAWNSLNIVFRMVNMLLAYFGRNEMDI